MHHGFPDVRHACPAELNAKYRQRRWPLGNPPEKERFHGNSPLLSGLIGLCRVVGIAGRTGGTGAAESAAEMLAGFSDRQPHTGTAVVGGQTHDHRYGERDFDCFQENSFWLLSALPILVWVGGPATMPLWPVGCLVAYRANQE